MKESSKHQLISFGKYKGYPIDVLKTDPEYCEWLTGQQWFVQRYPQINTLIVNHFGLPEDTPVHNELQARFLEEVVVNQLIRELFDTERMKQEASAYYSHTVENCRSRAGNTEKEIECDRMWSQCRKCKPFGDSFCDKAAKSAGEIEIEKVEFESSGWDVRIRASVKYGKYELGQDAHLNIFIEVKPELGDDYPSFLRQMIANGAERSNHPENNTRYVLAYNIFTATNVQIEQVKNIFHGSGIDVVSFASLGCEPAEDLSFSSCEGCQLRMRYAFAFSLIRQMKKLYAAEEQIITAMVEEFGWDYDSARGVYTAFANNPNAFDVHSDPAGAAGFTV